MVTKLDLYPEWRSRGWLPVAGDGCGNYYVLTPDGIVGFVDTMSDPDTIERQVSADLLAFMTELLAADQVLRLQTDLPVIANPNHQLGNLWCTGLDDA